MSTTCTACSRLMVVHPYTEELLHKLASSFSGLNAAIPPPALCPDCRKQRRLAYRNDFALYRRPSGFSGAPVLSIYSPEHPFPVYSFDEWWSDSWDAVSYGRPFDFNRPFFEQFAELRSAVPRIAVYCDNFCTNCEYSNQLTMSKDCYLLFSGSSNDACLYGYRINNCRSCIDCLYCLDSELCYECVDVSGAYNCRWCRNTTRCSDSSFLLDCQNCHHCLFCTGLRNASYCVFNRRCSREEYENLSAAYRFTSRQAVDGMRSRFAQFSASFPRKFAQLKQVEDVTGDNVQNARNCDFVFDGANLENVYYAQFVQDSRDCMDVNFCCDRTELHYEVCTGGIDAYAAAFCIDVWPTINNLLYCDSCSNGTRDCFGCIGLRHKQNCILNRQYAKGDYEQLLGRIAAHMQQTGEWGQFFPAKLSPFAYNESTAYEHFPLSAGEAAQKGFRWRPDDPRDFSSASAAMMPDDAQQCSPLLSKQTFSCSTCKRSYRVTTKEAELYSSLSVPFPEQCFFCRHRARAKLRNPRQLWQRKCSRCAREISTPFSPERPEKVYCEKCYTDEVN